MTGDERKLLNRKILYISIPIIIQNIISATVNSADVFMTSFIGQSSLSALSLASQYGSISFMFFLGINSAVIMLGSQYWGRGDVRTIEKVEGIAYRFSVAVGVVLTSGCLFAPQFLMKIYTPDVELIELGSAYLRAVAPNFIFMSISSVYLATLRSVERVSVSTVTETLALGINVTLNACFIFGFLGFPRLGITGIGIATSVSRLIQLIICVFVSIKSKNVRMRLGNIFCRDIELSRDFRVMALPSVGNEVGWALGFSMYSVVFGHLGNDVVAANSLVSVVRNLGATFCWGIGAAAGIIVGQCLGANKIEDGKEISGVMLRLAIITGAIGGVLIFLTRPLVVNAVNLTSTALDYLNFMLLVNSVYIIGTAVNGTLVTGVLRSGGNSKWGFIVDMTFMWLISVPLAFISAFVLKLPVKVVYLIISTDEFIKIPIVYRRYKSGKWAKNITRT